MIKRIIRGHFGFSQKETNGFIILVPLLFLIIFLPGIVRNHLQDTGSSPMDEKATVKWHEEILSSISKNEQGLAGNSEESPSLNLRSFDPNTISQVELIEMGLKPRIVKTIENYRTKGGKFKIKSDLNKIYGINDELFQELMPYIDLPSEISKKQSFTTKKSYSKKEPSPVIMRDINTATPKELRVIRGIGEVLSERIVSFRNHLGGFHSMSQLSEVYGLNDSTVNKLNRLYRISDSVVVSKIDLSATTEEDLRKHPYINYKLARLIASFSNQHEITTVDDIRQIKVLSDSTFKKISPYLTVSKK